MPVLRAILVALAVTGASAVAVPLAFPALVVQVDLPAFAGASHAGHDAHAGHAATARSAPGASHGHDALAHPATDHDAGDDPDHAHGASSAGDPAAAHDAHESIPAGDHHNEQIGMQRPRFPPAEGKIPSSPDGLQRISSLFVKDDEKLAEVATSGSGTLADPYVFRGLHVTGELNFLDTDACIEVAESWIAGQLTFNWNGQCIWAHHNRIHDLRVNENVRRNGYATGGLIEANNIVIVGQLRHFDGEFRNNVVGPAPPDALFDEVLETAPYLFVSRDTRVANVDGFNQGLIHHNTFHGTVDLDFHGHHHGTGFFAPHSHYHGDSDARMAEHLHDHTDRWTSVAFTDNLVIDREGYGLRYDDVSHAADDRTASSESTKELSEPHVHHTDILLARNTIEGGQLWIDVFNADDARHPERNPGTLTIEGNTITTREPAPSDWPCDEIWYTWADTRTPLYVRTVKEVDLVVRGNALTYVPHAKTADLLGTVQEAVRDCVLWSAEDDPAAMRLQGVRDSDILVEGNIAKGVAVGVDAKSMDDQTHWRVVNNQFPGQAVRSDSSVANEAQTR